tara:strand:+ start:13 stop:1152 length:1140 start_codon:yes stop_codon:yes gene_type:complete
MKKLLFRKFLTDHISQFLFFGLSLSVIVWVIQAVNFLEFVTEDGHGLKIYFLYTFLNLPKIFHRLLPFIFLLSLFYQLTKYEDRNELLIFWTHGIGYKKFINVIIIYSFLFSFFQIFLGSFISPKSQDTARSFIRSSTVDFFPNLIKEKKFVDVMDGLTIFADNKNDGNNYSNIILSENIGDNEIKIISAKSGNLISKDGNKYFELGNGKIIEINTGKITNFSFDKIIYNLDKYKTKTTTYQKIQEAPTLDLFICVNNYYLKNISKSVINFLQCQQQSFDDVKQEIFKRIIKPFYIPLVALICCLVIFVSREKINFKRKRFYIFIISFLSLAFSEILLKYSGKSIFGFGLFLLTPMIFFIIVYFYVNLRSQTLKVKQNA